MRSLNELIKKFFTYEEFKDSNYQCLERCLSKFCLSGKKEDAFCVYFCFCEIFEIFDKKLTMNKLLQLLSDHEYHSGELLTKHRDHYSHSVNVFALGLAIYANNETYRAQFNQFYKMTNPLDFLNYWGLTSLFHDIGYPFELAHQQIKAYTEELWGKKSILSPFVSYDNMEHLLTISEVGKSINNLLAEGLNKRLNYSIESLTTKLNERYKKNPEYMDHAFFSAILLARILLEEHKEISLENLDVLTAILLHNSLKKFELENSMPIKVLDHPLAYLLFLCDELQCWNRTAFGYISKKDPLAWDIELEIEKDRIKIEYIFDSLFIENPIENIRIENRNVASIKEKDIEKCLSNLIDINFDLKISYRKVEKGKYSYKYVSSDSLINLCDLAMAIHNSYQKYRGTGEAFESLSLEFKISNIEQAKSYSEKLELINCFFSDKELDYEVVTDFNSNQMDLEFLAREEHVRWVKERLTAGWKYGTDYKTKAERNEKKLNRDLVPYELLDEKEREIDRLMINNIISLLYHEGQKTRVYRFRYGRKPVLNIAGFGHRTISSNIEKLKEKIKMILKQYMHQYRVVVRTAYACGADQLIAECANELGIATKAVLPFPMEQYIGEIKKDSIKTGYKFDKEDEINLIHLLAQTVVCRVEKDDKHPYLAVGKYLISHCDKVIALWDGVETKLIDKDNKLIHQGGTYHCLQLAREKGLKEEDIYIISCQR